LRGDFEIDDIIANGRVVAKRDAAAFHRDITAAVISENRAVVKRDAFADVDIYDLAGCIDLEYAGAVIGYIRRSGIAAKYDIFAFGYRERGTRGQN